MNRTILSALLTVALFAATSTATAQSIIKRPGDHPDYVFEAEPHFLIPAPFDDDGFGLGFRGSVEIVDNGFVRKINNTVAIGFGLDWILFGEHCHGRGRDELRRCHDRSDFVFPVVMQWNFWLHRRWSVFGEPGVAFRVRNHDDDWHDDDDGFDFDPFVFYAGGRFHFTDNITLTMRLGYPTFSLGVSFLL